ncbi:MAG: hypothetical protein EOP16_00940 [Pseudonocardia sp.]|nr:MAG: hypothetical protein EOP16_00940 [Pseudonocardia sp.]
MASRFLDFDGDARAEIPISSPWGLGLLEYRDGKMVASAMQPNGTRFGPWLLNTGDNIFNRTGDFDGDGRAEILVSSPWGIGMLEQSGSTFGCPFAAPNGSRFGGWLLSTADNRFGPVGDFDGDGKDEVLFTSPWGIGIMKLQGSTFAAMAMAPNATMFGSWRLDTAVDRFGPVGDFDGDGKDEILVTSPSGIGILELNGTSISSAAVVSNGTRLGGWLLNTADNHFWTPADFDGNGCDDLLVTSPWGLGILTLSRGTITSTVMAANGTRFGGWLLNTADNRIAPIGDLDGDGRAEMLVSSPWGIGVLKQSDGTLTNPFLAANGTRCGDWLLNTADNYFDIVDDIDGDRRAEIVVTSPWGIGILKFTGSSMSCPMLAPNGTRFGGWLLNTADNQVGIGDQLIRLHVKILTVPNISIEDMIVEMQRIYEAQGIRVQRVSTEALNLPILNDVDVGACRRGSTTTEQNQLFANRASAGPLDIVVYFVRSTVPANRGCASHPASRPGAVVAQGASRWTLAHEVGHVLGLRHVDDPPPPDSSAPPALLDRLMTGRGTANITNPPPDVIATERLTLRGSRLTHNT